MYTHLRHVVTCTCQETHRSATRAYDMPHRTLYLKLGNNVKHNPSWRLSDIYIDYIVILPYMCLFGKRNRTRKGHWFKRNYTYNYLILSHLKITIFVTLTGIRQSIIPILFIDHVRMFVPFCFCVFVAENKQIALIYYIQCKYMYIYIPISTYDKIYITPLFSFCRVDVIISENVCFFMYCFANWIYLIANFRFLK